MQFIRIKHSYNAGDAITVLAGMQHVYRQTGKKFIFYQQLNFPAYYYDDAVITTKDSNGKSVCMNENMWNMLKPLLEAQEYIESCEIWEGQEVDINLDATRDRRFIPMPNGFIHYWTFAIAPEFQCDLSEAWLHYGWNNDNTAILINRTERYQNPYLNYYFLKEYENYLVFAGTEKEHELFCTKYKLDIPLVNVSDFLRLAIIVASCKLFIGNQSMCWHIADAMKKERILETCIEFPNTFPTGKNGYIAPYQEHLEIYTRNLFNKKS